jgi:capsular exopolysaccharide synthesis family protein
VDGDLRRPRVHGLFGVQTEVGLGQVIMGEAPVSAAVVPSGIDGLSLMTCGPRPDNPAELLTQPRFEQVLAELRGQFDFVIMDTPPLLAVTDPAVVVSRMDAVFLVVRLSRNGRPAAERAREILRTLRANVLGVVVNGVGKVMGAYGYENYSYEYGYGGAYAVTTVEANGHAAAATPAKATATAGRRRRRRGAVGLFRRWFR